MTQLTALQVAAAAYAGGFRGETQISQAVAVAAAESSWNTTAQNPCCKGLWQINLDAHKNTTSLIPNFNWQDPVHNAQAAFYIYHSSGGWCTRGSPPNCNPWAGYGTTSYNSALGQGRMAYAQLKQQVDAPGANKQEVIRQILGNTSAHVGSTPGEGVLESLPGADTAASILNTGKAFVEFLNRLGGWISNAQNWVRVLEVGGGVVLIIVGGTIVAKGTVTSVLPVGKVAKLLRK